MMKIVIEYQGKRYEGGESAEKTPKELAETLFTEFSSMEKLKMELTGGGFLVMGKQALQSAVVMILP